MVGISIKLGGKLVTLQKCAIRIINNKGYRSHTDLFKSQNILQIVDVYKLHVSLFMYDFHHNLLPKTFTNYIPKKNLDESSRITRQHNLLTKERLRTLSVGLCVFPLRAAQAATGATPDTAALCPECRFQQTAF